MSVPWCEQDVSVDGVGCYFCFNQITLCSKLCHLDVHATSVTSSRTPQGQTRCSWTPWESRSSECNLNVSLHSYLQYGLAHSPPWYCQHANSTSVPELREVARKAEHIISCAHQGGIRSLTHPSCRGCHRLVSFLSLSIVVSGMCL